MVRENQKTCPPSLLEFITLITYLFFLVTLRLSCLPLACHCLAYPSLDPIAARVLAYQHPPPPVPSFLLLPVYLCVQCLHVPESPAKFQSHQLWAPITFFWLGSFASFFGKVLKSRYNILTSRSLLLFCALEKNSNFQDHPLTLADTTLLHG